MNRPSLIDTDEASLNALSKESTLIGIRELITYIRHLETSLEQSQAAAETKPAEGTTAVTTSSSGAVSEDRLRQQQQEASRRENVLVMRLTAKEQEVQDYLSKLEEMRMNAASTSRSVLLDPAVNVIFQRMRHDLQQAKDQVEQTRQELNAWQFTPDSNMGKRLMARCRTLIQENEELGKLVNSGRVAKLEGDLSMLRTHCQELQKSQTEVDDYLLVMDEDLEAMQATVIYVQKQLKISTEENKRMREMLGLGFDGTLDEELAKKRELEIKEEGTDGSEGEPQDGQGDESVMEEAQGGEDQVGLDDTVDERLAKKRKLDVADESADGNGEPETHGEEVAMEETVGGEDQGKTNILHIVCARLGE